MLQIELDDIKAFYGLYGTLAPGMADQLFQAVVVKDVVLAVEPTPGPVAAKSKRAAKVAE